MQDFFLARGRTGRLNYFFGHIGICIVMAMPIVMSSSVDPVTGDSTLGAIGWLATAFGVWAITANTIRRAHDINKRGWYVLLMGIPLVGLVISLQLQFEPGTHGPNKHGVAAGTGSHQPGDMNAHIERTHAKAVAAHGPEPEYYNDDGSFNMDGLFQNSAK